MVHATLVVFIFGFGVGVAGLTFLAQKRSDSALVRFAIVQLAIFNLILVLHILWFYFTLNLADGAAPAVIFCVALVYHLIAPVLKLLWVAALVLMVSELIQRPLPRGLRRTGAAGLGVLLLLLAGYAGHAVATGSLVQLASTHLALELVVIASTWAATLALVSCARGLDPEARRRAAAVFGAILVAVFTPVTLLLAFGESLWPGSAMARLLINALLLLCYNLFPFLVPWRRLLQAAEPELAQHDFERLAAEYGVSPREQEVIRLVCQGRPNREIAGQLNITLQTVKDHNYRIFRKLGISNRVQLVNRVRDLLAQPSQQARAE